MLGKHGVEAGWERGGTVVLGGTGRPCLSFGRVHGVCGLKLFEGFWLGFAFVPFLGVLED